MRRMIVVASVGMAVLILVGLVATAVAQAPRGGGEGGDREARMAQMMQQMTDRMKAAGATDADVQAIRAHMTLQRETTGPLSEALRGLREAASDDAAKAAVAKYETDMKAAKDKLAKAEQDLRTKLNLASKPRLHALLLTMGTLDNGTGGRGGMFGGGGAGGRGGAGGGGATR
jgi:cytochrome c556